MKELPKVAKKALGEISGKSVKPVVAGLVAGVIAGVSSPTMASTASAQLNMVSPSQNEVQTAGEHSNAALIMEKPSLDGQVFAAHYSHSSHASHASHYSCTPGSTC